MRERQATARETDATSRPAVGPTSPGVAQILALQRGAGNRAVARALTPSAEHIADEVFEGVDGLGTDEDRIFAAMRPVVSADIPQLSSVYRARHGSDLVGDLRDDLSDDELQANIAALRRTGPDAVAFELEEAMEGVGTDEGRIYRALSGVGAAELPGIETAYRARTGRELRADLSDELSTDEFRRLPVYQAVGLDAVAQQIHDAVNGPGTDENAVFGALAGRSQARIDQVAAAYQRMYGVALIDDLRGDLSDSEMARLGTLSPMFALAGSEAAGGAQAVAVQLQDAIEGPGTNEEAIFAALSNRTPEEIAAIRASYLTLTGRGLEADLRDDLSGDDLVRALAQIGVVETVSERDTELGGLMFGNFDFDFSGAAVVLTVRLKFEFRDDVPEAERAPYKTKFLDAVKAVWEHPPIGLHGEGPCPNPDVTITVNVFEDEGSPHKLVDVTNEDRREHVISDVNVSKVTTAKTMAHEFGHVLGLCDEYDGGIENVMFWHENRADDPDGIMNDGTEFRSRYFENVRQRVRAAAPPGCVYHVVRTH